MEAAAGRFLVFNLLPSVAAGLWATLAVFAATALAGVRSAEVRNELLVLPLIKSTLVLLGLATAMPVGWGIWGGVRANALPAGTVAPWLLLWAGAGILGLEWLRRRAGHRATRDGEAAAPGSRPVAALERLRRRFRERRRGLDCPYCSLPDEMPRPRLYLSDAARSPALVFDRPPRLVLPRRLESELDDAELEAVIAHELAHLWLRRPCGGLCEAARMRSLAAANPTGLLLGGLLGREEELACDEIAAGITGDPEALASALMKTCRYRRRRRFGLPALEARLLGPGPLLRRRVERLLAVGVRRPLEPRGRRWAACVVAVVLSLVEFG